jgi:hypothetical protein
LHKQKFAAFEAFPFVDTALFLHKVSSPPALETLSFQGDFAAPRRLKLPILDVDYRLMASQKLFFLTLEFLNYLQERY